MDFGDPESPRDLANYINKRKTNPGWTSNMAGS